MRYKNVFTILEKVKKKELIIDNQQSLFTKMAYFQKRDIISPYLHWLDENSLNRIFNGEFMNESQLRQHVSEFQKKKPMFNKLNTIDIYKKTIEKYKILPNHIPYDVFKLYYNNIEKLEFKERTEFNFNIYKLLEYVNNPIGKVLSENSNLKSSIFAKNVLRTILIHLACLELTTPPKQDGQPKKSIEEQIKDSLDDPYLEKMMSNILIKSSDDCMKLDKYVSEETQDTLFDENSVIDDSFLSNAESRITKIEMHVGTLNQKLKKLMNRAISHFNAKRKIIYDDLLNSSDIGGIEDWTFFHPSLRKIFIEDVVVKDTINIGKLDVYLDVSGSMSNHYNGENRDISRVEFAKSFALKLLKEGMLNDLYTFNTRVAKIKSNIWDISFIKPNGGTDLDKVVEKISNNSNNAIVITDGEDNCQIYNEKAFFIGLKGCKFSYFNPSVIYEYVENEQVIIFDGQNIFNVNSKGYIIN